MRAIRVSQYGGPEVMKLEELPTPKPGEGQALVRIEAAGVNFIDVYQRTGLYKGPLPLPLGLEGAGVVEEVGPGVTTVKPGARVAWTGVPGSYATHNLVPADRLVLLPAGLDARAGAAAMLQGMTAHYLAHSSYPLKRGDSCLVHAAAGGVGLLLVQMAKRAGARVIGTVSTEEKAKFAREAGTDDVILYTRQDFEAEVKRLTGGKGLQVVYDSVAKDTFDKGLNCLALRGFMILYGQSSGPIGPFDPQILNQKGSLFLQRPSLNHHIATREDLEKRAGEVLGWIQKGELKLRIGATFPLAEAAEAHRQLEGRKTTGKVLLIP
ncbi:MAG TPA: quinone oxidoreductase [Methylomirabilota bacterium]|jgi:NADPH2:quinone reductase|nr:quinone oxidoreductase [Methylomirabilota bacterium]